MLFQMGSAYRWFLPMGCEFSESTPVLVEVVLLIFVQSTLILTLATVRK
jgi:hypothetical protein